MKKIINFIKLDFLSIKEYITIKRLLSFFLISIFIGIANKSPLMAIAMTLFFIMSFATYPFAASDQNNLDILYLILGYDRKDVVLGRYGTVLSIYILGICLETILYVIVSLVLRTPINLMELLFLNAVLRFTIIVGQSFQIPSYFKEGYLKSKLTTYLPYIIFFALFMIVYTLIEKEILFNLSIVNTFIETQFYLIALILLIMALAIFAISYKLSQKYYMRREF